MDRWNRAQPAATLGLVACLAFWALAATGCSRQAATVSPPPALTTALHPTRTASLFGRWAPTPGGETVLACGSGLRYRFLGSTTALELAVPQRAWPTEAEWRIDGATWHRAPLTPHMILASNLSAGWHECDVRLAGTALRDDRWNGWLGLTVVGIRAHAVQALPRAGRKLLVVGDSIAEGDYALGYDPRALSDAPRFGTGHLAFPQLLADSHEASYTAFAFGGAAIAAPSFGLPPLADAIDYSMAGIPAHDGPWDVVLIEGGINDTSTEAGQFSAAYGRLIDRVRALSPQARIFCMAPIRRPGAETSRSGEIRSVAEAKGCEYIDTAEWRIPTPNLGHPDVSGQAMMAALLEPTVGRALEAASGPL